MKLLLTTLSTALISFSAAIADDIVCAQVITIAKNKQGICRVFPNACLSDGFAATKANECDCDKLEFSPELSKEFQVAHCKDSATNGDLFAPKLLNLEETSNPKIK